MEKEEFNQFERIVLRNQRYMMLAISAMFRNTGGVASGYHADKLIQRVTDMERAWEWIASPGERI